MDAIQASAASDFTRETKLVELPRQQNGKTLAVEIGAVPLPELIVALEGVPGATAAPDPTQTRTFAEIRESIVASIEPSKRVAALGLLAPAFSFDERESGKAFWGDVQSENQAFIITQIMTLSGLTGEASAKADPS